MKFEFNDRECYIAATALNVRTMQFERGIADEPTMEDRQCKLDLIARGRSAMQEIDRAWRAQYAMGRPGDIKGFAQGELSNRKIVIDLEKSELQELISILDGRVGEVTAKEVRALSKRLKVLADAENK